MTLSISALDGFLAHLGEVLALLFLDVILVKTFLLSEEFHTFSADVRNFIDFCMYVELACIGTAFNLLEWISAISFGAHWGSILGSAYRNMLHWKKCCVFTFILMSCGVAWYIHGYRKRWTLRGKRRFHVVQSKKRYTGRGEQRSFESKLRCFGLQILILLGSSSTCNAMDAQQFGQFMEGFSTLLQRQEAFMQGMAGTIGTGSSSSTAEASAAVAKSLESAAKILKTPDFFDVSDSSAWVTWRHSFMNWLGYADSRFLDSLRDIEKLAPSEEVETVESRLGLGSQVVCHPRELLAGVSFTVEQIRCRRPQWVFVVEESIGHYSPATRQRALALSQAISSFPSYKAGGDKSLQEHIMSMEMLVQQYDSVSSKAFDRDVLLGVLLRLCPEAVRQHLTLSISDATS